MKRETPALLNWPVARSCTSSLGSSGTGRVGRRQELLSTTTPLPLFCFFPTSSSSSCGCTIKTTLLLVTATARPLWHLERGVTSWKKEVIKDYLSIHMCVASVILYLLRAPQAALAPAPAPPWPPPPSKACLNRRGSFGWLIRKLFQWHNQQKNSLANQLPPSFTSWMMSSGRKKLFSEFGKGKISDSCCMHKHTLYRV